MRGKMKLVINNFDATHYGEKKQTPIRVLFKRKFSNGEYYYFIVYPNGENLYMSLDQLEHAAITKINTRKIKTI